jgi:hypothetical protein
MDDFDRLFLLIERLRKEAIGEPVRIQEKDAYEYQENSAKVVAVLKLVRAAHGIASIHLLCGAGLFIDFGAIVRCINDAVAEVYFLLEKYPETSTNVDRFVKAFFESTIDGYLFKETPAIESKKIRSATVRHLRGQHDDELTKLMERIYKTFCGYVHADYAHILEVYNGATHSFNLTGVPSARQGQKRMLHVVESAKSVMHAAAFTAHTLGLADELYREIRQWLMIANSQFITNRGRGASRLR